MPQQRRAQDNGTRTPTATTGGVSPASNRLPRLADWREGAAGLSKRDQQAAVRALAPLLAQLPEREQDAWTTSIIGMGAYKPSVLARLLARAAEEQPADDTAGDEAPAFGDSLPGTAFDGPEPTQARRRPRGEHRVPGSTWTYTPEVGVWDDKGNQLIDWCPVVTENLLTFRDDGRVMGRSVSLHVGPHATTAEVGDVEAGRVWDALPATPGTADRKVRDALTNIVNDQARRLPEIVSHPRWVDDRLQLPPADCLPQGYTAQGGTFEGWCELMRRSLDAPKIALVISLAVAGIYVKPCRRKSYVVHMKGVSSRGKTTSMIMAAGVFGDPEEGQVVENWNSTQNGIPAWLRGLRVLPGFRDEIQSAGFAPRQLQDLMFRITGGGSRGQSTRTGGYRKPAATWGSALISTGNVSIVGTTDNTAMFARVIELDTPFTDNADQAEAFEDMALTHYGWGLPAVIEQGITPADWNEWCAKALVALGNPAGDVLRRAGKHLAGAVAAARLLGRIVQDDRFESVVTDAAKAALESIGDDLGFKGTNSPSQQFLFALIDSIAQDPRRFPTPAEWQRIKNNDPDFRMPPNGILGWNIADDPKPGEIALLPVGFDHITEKLTDRLIVLKELDRVGQIHRKKGARAYADQRWIAGKNERAYVISGLAELLDDQAEERADLAHENDPPSTSPSTGSSNQKTGPGQATSTSNTFSRTEGHVREADASDDELLAILAAGTASDAELEAAAAELERREKAPSVATDTPNPLPEGKETDQGENVNERPSQVPVSAVPKGRGSGAAPATADGADAAEELESWTNWLAGDQMTAWLATRGIQASPKVASRALAAWHWSTQPTSNTNGEQRGGVRWAGSPGRTGLKAYRMLRAIHPQMPDPEQAEHPAVTELTENPELITKCNFMTSGVEISEGMHITSADVSAQFAAAAKAVVLGIGDPVVNTNRPRVSDALLALPGYVVLEKDTRPDHYAFPEVIPAGTPIVNPLALYLHQRGVTLRLASSVTWPDRKGQYLKAHASLFVGEGKKPGAQAKLRHAAANATDDQTRDAARIAEAAVKAVYAVTYGGMLRSERHGGEEFRRDWSDQLVGLAWANALRAVDRAAYDVITDEEALPCNGFRGAPFTSVKDGVTTVSGVVRDGRPLVHTPLGMCKDTVFWLHDNAEAWVPRGLEISENRQPGKWHLEKHVPVTDRIAEVVNSNEGPYALRDAVNATFKEVEA